MKNKTKNRNNNTKNRKDINHKSYIIHDKTGMCTININGG